MPSLAMSLIEHAIRVNCAIDKSALKKLILVRTPGPSKAIGIGRTLFLHLAHRAGHSTSDICEYLDMSEDEYKGKMSRLPKMLEEGKVLFEQGIEDFENSSHLFYRKLTLILNYMRLSYRIDLQ